MAAQAIIVMGVSGSGKTTTGQLLGRALGWPFYDADEDREPWLAALAYLIDEALSKDEPLVLACSALKAAYRERLKPRGAASERVRFVYLRVPPEVAAARIRDRRGHFMPATLVPSQFAALEEPDDATVVDATQSPEEIVAAIRRALAL